MNDIIIEYNQVTNCFNVMQDDQFITTFTSEASVDVITMLKEHGGSWNLTTGAVAVDRDNDEN